MHGSNPLRPFAIIIGNAIYRPRFFASNDRIDHDDAVGLLQFGQCLKDRRANIQHGDPFRHVFLLESLGGMNPDTFIGKQHVSDAENQQFFTPLCLHQYLGFTETIRALLFGLIT